MSEETELIEKYVDNITWYMNSCIQIKGSKTIYFDPYGVTEDAPKADFVLTTHPHIDNYSLNNINQIMDKNSEIFLTNDAEALIMEGKVTTVVPFETYERDSLIIRTIPAYNINSDYHPKEKDWVGYIIELDGITYYHAGDTDLIPEINDIENIDVAMLPIGGIYTMDKDQAIEAVKIIKPKVVIPIHFGMIVGSYDDAEYFVNNCPSPATILKVQR